MNKICPGATRRSWKFRGRPCPDSFGFCKVHSIHRLMRRICPSCSGSTVAAGRSATSPTSRSSPGRSRTGGSSSSPPTTGSCRKWTWRPSCATSPRRSTGCTTTSPSTEAIRIASSSWVIPPAQLAALVCIDDRYLKAEGLSLAIIKGCVPVDGDTYDVPAIIETAETRRRVHGQPQATNGHREKFGNAPAKHRDLSAVTHVARDKGIPPFLIMHVAEHPDTSAAAQRLATVLNCLLGKPYLLSIPRESAGHQMDHRQLDERLAAGRRPLVVLAQPPPPAQPGERPLHPPTERHHLERLGPRLASP